MTHFCHAGVVGFLRQSQNCWLIVLPVITFAAISTIARTIDRVTQKPTYHHRPAIIKGTLTLSNASINNTASIYDSLKKMPMTFLIIAHILSSLSVAVACITDSITRTATKTAAVTSAQLLCNHSI